MANGNQIVSTLLSTLREFYVKPKQRCDQSQVIAIRTNVLMDFRLYPTTNTHVPPPSLPYLVHWSGPKKHLLFTPQLTRCDLFFFTLLSSFLVCVFFQERDEGEEEREANGHLLARSTREPHDLISSCVKKKKK